MADLALVLQLLERSELVGQRDVRVDPVQLARDLGEASSVAETGIKRLLDKMLPEDEQNFNLGTQPARPALDPTQPDSGLDL